MAQKVKYEARLTDRETGQKMGWKKGKLWIRDKDNSKSIADRIAEKHLINLEKTDIEIRLHNFTFKPKDK